jgi:RNA polymerase sigma-70 factor, ECF subfamily
VNFSALFCKSSAFQEAAEPPEQIKDTRPIRSTMRNCRTSQNPKEVFAEVMEDTNLSRYMDGLYAYAMVLSRNSSLAADLVQETYVRALKAKESLRTDSNVKSWLFTILRNIWLNQLRHERAAPKIAELDSDENLADVSVSTEEGPHGLYVRKLERERVRTAIEQLPVEFREIIILREYEELSYSEIANLLQCPLGTVMSRLARARSKLGALLSISQEPLPNVADGTVANKAIQTMPAPLQKPPVK